MADRVLHLADGRITHVDRNASKITAGGAVLVKAINRKLLRDLWHLRSQVVTVALVVGSAFSGFAGSLATYHSLINARDDFYASARFAHVFSDIKRAPLAVEPRIAGGPRRVGDAETPIVYDVTLDLPGVALPIVGRLVALPLPAETRLNRLVIRRGRAPEPGRGG